MRFYSGFCLEDESFLFSHLIENGAFNLYGFSYGAIKAFEETKKKLENFERVDKLVLFSPAFFQTSSQAFKKLQLRSFSKNSSRYLNNFIKSCFAPYDVMDVKIRQDGVEDLEKLLYHEWKRDELLRLNEQGVVVEVYLGEKDEIIDVNGAFEFFKDVANVTFFKNANHFLQFNQ